MNRQQETRLTYIAHGILSASAGIFLTLAMWVILTTDFRAEAQPVPTECPVCTCPPPPPPPPCVVNDAAEAARKALEAIKAAEQKAGDATQQLGPKP